MVSIDNAETISNHVLYLPFAIKVGVMFRSSRGRVRKNISADAGLSLKRRGLNSPGFVG
jgi:hypothetical protein